MIWVQIVYWTQDYGIKLVIKDLKLGIIGLSEGNGHPYSWSAIFNGYDETYMDSCPFPVIPQYLRRQEFPRDAIPGCVVSHVWTQEYKLSKEIANASKIEHIARSIDELITKVDAVLLARDDAENHFEFAKPIIESGLPIFIDKPIAFDLATAKRIFNLEKYKNQIFTCSSLKYAKEFSLTVKKKEEFGKIVSTSSYISGPWDRYSVHIIEPTLSIIGEQGNITSYSKTKTNDSTILSLQWESGVVSNFSTFRNVVCPVGIQVFGRNLYKELILQDTYHAFKKSLLEFIKQVRGKNNTFRKKDVFDTINIVELGNN